MACGKNQKEGCTLIMIILKNVNKSIKKNKILTDVDLELEAGSIYGFKGRNGCGKTMLMRMIGGLIIPDSGDVIIDGKKLHKDVSFPPSMGVLIENPAFLPGYTGRNNLRMLAKLMNGITDCEIDEALTSVGLDPFDKRKYRQYSLGMKQKLGIANAILGKPELIMLDEPINALDEETVAKIRVLLRGLRDEGKLIIIACHDREELEYLSDEIILIKEGKIAGREKVKHEAD